MIFSGGGVENNTLMSDIKQLLAGDVVTTTYFKNESFFIESSAFAYIAVRTLKKLPSSFPSTTGCIKSSTSGSIYFPNNYLRYTFIFSITFCSLFEKMIR